jgi:hypothetical protein
MAPVATPLAAPLAENSAAQALARRVGALVVDKNLAEGRTGEDSGKAA